LRRSANSEHDMGYFSQAFRSEEFHLKAAPAALRIWSWPQGHQLRRPPMRLGGIAAEGQDLDRIWKGLPGREGKPPSLAAHEQAPKDGPRAPLAPKGRCHVPKPGAASSPRHAELRRPPSVPRPAPADPTLSRPRPVGASKSASQAQQVSQQEKGPRRKLSRCPVRRPKPGLPNPRDGPGLLLNSADGINVVQQCAP